MAGRYDRFLEFSCEMDKEAGKFTDYLKAAFKQFKNGAGSKVEDAAWREMPSGAQSTADKIKEEAYVLGRKARRFYGKHKTGVLLGGAGAATGAGIYALTRKDGEQ